MRLSTEQRRELVDLIENGITKSAACKKLGISRPIGYKWLQRFYDDGYDGLEDHSSAPKSSPNKIPQEIKERVLKTSMAFPDLGAGSLVQKLSELDIKITAPTIQSILTKSNRRTQWDRFRQNLNVYKKEPTTLSDDTLKRMERISRNFKYRSLFTQKPGQRVFLWTESGHVTGSGKHIPLFIFLDMCGLFVHVFYPQNILKRRRSTRAVSDKIGYHPLTDSTVKVLENTYKILGLQIEELTFCSLASSSKDFLQQELLDYNVKVTFLPKSDFYQLPFINNVRSIIRSRLKKPLRNILFKGKPILTEIQILELIQIFHENFNKESVIAEYPNLGVTPYDYLTLFKDQNIINQIINITNKPLDTKKAIAIKYNII